MGNDLTFNALDRYVCNLVKTHFYIDKIQSTEHLKQRNRAAIEIDTTKVLNKVWEGNKFRKNVCRVKHGAHLEVR